MSVVERSLIDQGVPWTTYWDTNFWPSSQRRYSEHYVNNAAYWAYGYLTGHLSVEPSTQSIYPYITTGAVGARAVAIGTDIIHLYIGLDEIQHRKLGHRRIDADITSAIVHESIHNTRELVFPFGRKGIIERIASEGVAYVAQAYAERDIFNIAERDTALGSKLEDPIAILEELYSDPKHFEDFSDEESHEQSELIKEWLGSSKNASPFSWGQKLGIWCVEAWIEEFGYDFTDLVHMPAEEMIAL